MKKIMIINILIISILIALATKSYGVLTSKPTTQTDGSNVVVRTTTANSYGRCKEMTNNGESLYGTTVQPHLATNKDWGAVSYLSNSIYGTNTAGKNKGIEITINDVKYYSTNGNASGVMNWGINPYKTLYTQTAGLIENYTEGNSNVDGLYPDRLTEFVDFINPRTASLTKGMAIQETTGLYADFSVYNSMNNPVSIRSGLFGGAFGQINNVNSSGRNYEALNNVTFRPAIWN